VGLGISEAEWAAAFSTEVICGRGPLIVPDARADSRFALDAGVTGEPHIRLYAGVPLVTPDGSSLGTLSVIDRAPRTLTSEQADGLRRLAGQVVTQLELRRHAVEAGRNAAEIDARRRVAEALAEVGRAVTQSTDPLVVGQRIATILRTLLGVLSVVVFRLEPESGTLTSVAASDSAGLVAVPAARVLPKGTGAVGLALREGGPIASPNVLADPRISLTPEARTEIDRSPLRGALALPLLVEGRAIGALAVVDREGRIFSREEIGIAQSFADQAALALEYARLTAETESRRRAAVEVARIAQRLTETLNLTDVGQRIAESVRRLFGARFARLRLLEPDGSLSALAWAGSTPEGPGRTLPPGTGVAGKAVGAGKPVWYPDALDAPDLVLDEVIRRQMRESGERAILGIPLRAEGTSIGALTIGDEAGRVFSDDDVTLLQTFADHAALALRNATLYEDAARRRREAEILADLARTANASLDIDVILQRVAEAARELCGSDRAMIAVRDAESDAMIVRYRAGARSDAYRNRRVEPGKGVGGQVLLTGRPFRTANYAEDARVTKDYLQWAPDDASVTSVAVPVRIGDRIEGLLYAQNRSPRPFGERDEAILAQLADHAAIAIKNARLFAREQTARAEAEETSRALAESEERYHGLFDHLPVGLYRATPEGQILAANPALAHILGYPDAGALMAASAVDFWEDPEERRDALGGRIEQVGVLRDFDARWRRADGRVIWVRNNVRAIAGADGRVLYYEGAAEDITERKQLEAQLQQAQKMEAIGRLAGGIAHDFNNLLTVITGRAEILRVRLGPDVHAAAARDLHLVQETARRAAALTGQLLAFSRKQVLQPKVLDLNDVIRGMSPMLRRLIGEDVELVIIPGAGLGRVRADVGRLEQVVMNLAVNARDAMPRGGRLILETANVELDEAFSARQPGSRPGSHVLLSVSDTGVGMDEGTRSRVFEPFFTTKEPGKGTGLGLSMVYGIVKQHEGYVAVASAPGQGATFRIYLPRAEGVLDATVAGPTGSSPQRGAETILLVEDEDEVRELTREVLELNGYDVLVARHPGEALLLCERHPRPIHLLVTDLVMPQMNGQELAQRLTGLRPDLKVLYMSAYSDALLDRQAIAAAGRIPLLEKPFLPDQLSRKVRETLDSAP